MGILSILLGIIILVIGLFTPINDVLTIPIFIILFVIGIVRLMKRK